MKKTKRKKRRSGHSDIFSIIAWAIIGLAILAGVRVWQRVQVGELYREIGEIEDRLAELEYTNAVYSARLEKLKDFRRVTDIAEKKLGLVFPEKHVLRLNRKQQKLAKDDTKN